MAEPPNRQLAMNIHPKAGQPMAPSESTKLDFLRAFAVLTVVFSHVFFESIALANLGRVGVLLFFVHTSLVLMFSLERQTTLLGRGHRYTSFMIRRMFRIYPLSVVAVILVFTFAIPAYVFPNGSVYHTGTDALGLTTNLLLVQNIVVSDEGNQLLGVLWTLPIEFQMYLLLPVIFSILPRVKGARLLIIIWIGSALVAISGPKTLNHVFGPTLVAFDWGRVVSPRLLEFAPAFLAGILAYRFWTVPKKQQSFALLPVLLTGFLTLYALTSRIPVPGIVTSVTWMLSCLVIGLLLPRIAEPNVKWLGSGSATIAKYSYGIYLVHVPCIWLGFDYLSDQHFIVQWIVFLSSTALISAALYHLVEKPFIDLGTRVAQGWSGAARP